MTDLVPITTREEIDAAQRQLEERIQREAIGPIEGKLGHPNGTQRVEFWYVRRLDMWFCAKEEDHGWWNPIGLGSPEDTGRTSVVEVNPRFDGSRKRGGAFLRDADGRVWLAHNGLVRSGKSAFLRAFRDSIEEIDGKDYIIIGRIADDDFLDKLAAFARRVQSSKQPERAAIDHDTEAVWIDDLLQDADETSRRAAFEWLAEAIHLAHSQSEACWAVTQRPGPRLRLLVGAAVAFEIGRKHIGVGLHLPSIPERASAETASDIDVADFPFARIDDGVYRTFSPERFLAHAEVLRPAAWRFIEFAAKGYPNSPYARHHLPDLLDDLADLLGTDLPKPTHAGAEVAPSYWKIAPGRNGLFWPQCRDGGFIAIGWDELGDLTGIDRDGFDAHVDTALAEGHGWKRRGVEQVWRFLNIPVGAKIVANDGTRRVLGIGTVTGRYQYAQDSTEFRHRLPVAWDDVRERVVEQKGWVRTIIQLAPAVFTAVVNAPSPGDELPEPAPPEAKPTEKLEFEGIMDRLDAARLRFPDEIVASYLLALQAKRFVVLSGISGTGKTQLALAIAEMFQPPGASASEASRHERDADALTLRVRPYMIKHRRIVIPAVMADSIAADTDLASITVRYGDGQTESLRWYSGPRHLTFKGGFRKWFAENFKLGDELELRLETDDPPVLAIAPTSIEEATAPAPTTYEIVAVRPDWTDNRGLLGYYNPITREYQTTPFLRLLLAAAEEEDRAESEGGPRMPFFIVLDEMNLARVEHYFSDFLSCLESGKALHLHDDPQVAEGLTSDTGDAVPMQLAIPRNLFFTGTVNVDETTYMFSPKVLDRSFVLEFNDVDLENLGAELDDDADGDSSPLRLSRFAGALDIRDKPGPEDYVRFRELDGGTLHRALHTLNDRLQAEHRHFGYRVANEIARFVTLAETQAGKDRAILWEAFDVAILAKVLPKLHGTQQELEDVLQSLLAFAVDVAAGPDARERESTWTYATGRIHPKPDAPSKTPRLPRSAAKLWRMLRRVRQQGYVSFIE